MKRKLIVILVLLMFILNLTNVFIADININTNNVNTIETTIETILETIIETKTESNLEIQAEPIPEAKAEPVSEPTTAPVVIAEPTKAPVVIAEPTTAPVVIAEPTKAPVVIAEPTKAPVVIAEPAIEAGVVYLNTDFTSQGLIKIRYKRTSEDRIKLIIQNGERNYIYNLQADGVSENFSLQLGSGDYVVSVLQNTSGTKYTQIYTNTISVNIKDEKSVYLNSIQNVNWNVNMQAIKKAKDLTKNTTSDTQKISIIYNYIIDNFSYDFDKLNNVPTTYIPNIENTLNSKNGICYDYSALFGSMLRSLGIPAKMVKGYSDYVAGYHAWNEVYLEKEGRWIIIDTTVDSQLNGKRSIEMEKVTDKYTKSKEY